jgi:hypothetical protein
MTAEQGIWVYAVTERGGGVTLPGLAGVSGARVRLAHAGGLTAVVSDVELTEYGADALRRNLEDLAWLEAVARAHHGDIDATARLFTVLPMRLATVYGSDAGMAAALEAFETPFQAALGRLRGRTEWGVKGYAAPSPHAAGPATAKPPEDGAATGEGGAGTGMAYLRRRRDALAAQRESRHAAADSARAVHAELSRHAADSCLHPPQSPQLSNRADAMVLNAAYLLDDDITDQFAQAVAALNDRDQRLRLELTGPWPPYSFAAPDLDEEEDREEALWPPHRRQPRPRGSPLSGSRLWTCWTGCWRGAW